MSTKPSKASSTAQPLAPRPSLTAVPATPAAGLTPLPDRTFEMCFTSTPRGARLARRLAGVRLDAWGVPYGTDPHDVIVLIVGEFTANAVQHGYVPGRDFRLRLQVAPDGRTVRVEVADTRAERVPRRPGAFADTTGAVEAGRGLLLVAHFAARWGWHPRPDGPGKTVWAEYAYPPFAMV